MTKYRTCGIVENLICGKPVENFLDQKLNLNEFQKKALKAHFEILMQWKKVHNLTAIHCPEEIYRYHYMDSLLGLLALTSPPTPLQQLERGESQGIPNTIYDLGSGAGFPGLMAAVLWPDKDIFLVESSSKKYSFLRIASLKMGLNRVKILSQRAESLQEISFAITRATFSAESWKLLPRCLAKNGQVAFWLSEQESIERPGWVLERRYYYELEPRHRRQVAVFHVEPQRK